MYTGGLDEPAGKFDKPMTEELKKALITIAEYDCKPTQEYKGKILIGEEYSVTIEGIDYGKEIQWYDCKYHTSADALLPVYRKARDFDIRVGMGYDGSLKRVADLILYDNLSWACIKLSKIIKQLK